MIKKIIAVPAGVLAGGLGIYLTETLGHKLYPLPAGMDPNDMDAMASYVSTAPFMALFCDFGLRRGCAAFGLYFN